jgi:hypothetical protein
MNNLTGSRPFPVLGRFDDYSDTLFKKRLSLDLRSGAVEIDNEPNLVNALAKQEVKDYLVVENPQTAFKDLIELPEGTSKVQLDLAKLLGLTRLTLLQVSQGQFELPAAEDVNQFFKTDQESTVFQIRPGEVLGYGETLTIDVAPSTGSSWIVFSNTGDPSFEFSVEHGKSGKIVVSMGSKLYDLCMSSLTDPASKIWANLAFAKPAIEFAILEMFSDSEIEEGSAPSWADGLRLSLKNIGISGIEDVKELNNLQKAAMKLLEEPALLPLVDLMSENSEG